MTHAGLRRRVFRCRQYIALSVPVRWHPVCRGRGPLWGDDDGRSGTTSVSQCLEAGANAEPGRSGTRYGIGEPDGRRFWNHLVHATFVQTGLPDDFDAFFDELYDRFADAATYRLYPETLTVLERLGQAGYIVGVISNWDSRLTGILEGLGLMAHLHHVTISAVVGWEKPHREVFDHAVNAVAVSPSRALHIGDSLREDIQGAAQAGLQPLWVQRQSEHQRSPDGDYPVIQDLTGVFDWLETPEIVVRRTRSCA